MKGNIQTVYKKIQDLKIVPVAVLKDLEHAETVFDVLERGGLPIAEITFRTECAERAVRLARDKYPQILVGAGTVLNEECCRAALCAGAQFIVSPGFSKQVADLCRSEEVLYLPGVVTPTEIMSALLAGIDHVKFFPAETFGGLKAVQALGAAFRQVRFMPTGGVNAATAKEYLKSDKIFAVGGSWMLSGTVEEMYRKITECVELVRSL